MMKSTGLGVEEERILYDAMIGTRGGGYLYKQYYKQYYNHKVGLLISS